MPGYGRTPAARQPNPDRPPTYRSETRQLCRETSASLPGFGAGGGTAPDRTLTQERSDCQQQRKRRPQVDPTTCEKSYSDEEITFMKAMYRYMRAYRRPFPTSSE